MPDRSDRRLPRPHPGRLGYGLISLAILALMPPASADNVGPLWPHAWRPKLPIIEGASDEGVAIASYQAQPHLIVDRRKIDLLGSALGSFVAAHQYGHFVLGHRTSTAVASISDASNDYFSGVEEHQADCYALRLLRRRDPAAIETLIKQRPFDPPAARAGHIHVPDFSALQNRCDRRTVQNFDALRPPAPMSASLNTELSND